MNRDLLIAFLVSILLHGGFALSGNFFKSKPAPPPPAEDTIPFIELTPLPPVEPDPVELSEPTGEPGGDLSDIAPPMQTDTPAPTVSMFVQPIQPPPLPSFTRPTSTIVIPTRPAGSGIGPGAGDGLKNLFDLASLDQPPVPRMPIRAVYPSEMSRAGTNGEVVVGFIVDADGNVHAPYVVSSTNPAFETEAIRAVSRAKFKPGRKNGVNVSTRNVRIPIIFNITGR